MTGRLMLEMRQKKMMEKIMQHICLALLFLSLLEVVREAEMLLSK